MPAAASSRRRPRRFPISCPPRPRSMRCRRCTCRSRGIREPCLDFVDSLWTNRGGFFGTWADDAADCEYTYYALLALGHLSLEPVVMASIGRARRVPAAGSCGRLLERRAAADHWEGSSRAARSRPEPRSWRFTSSPNAGADRAQELRAPRARRRPLAGRAPERRRGLGRHHPQPEQHQHDRDRVGVAVDGCAGQDAARRTRPAGRGCGLQPARRDARRASIGDPSAIRQATGRSRSRS